MANWVRQAIGNQPPSLESIVDRIEALRGFVDVAQPHVPGQDLVAARRLVGRAGERLSLSRAHTVVALAGATGSGKSSLFNGLAGLDLSPVGLRRPTTGEAHACVWGSDDASPLLDWLGVGRRFIREAAGAQDLDGLVMLDLPDFDSVETAHRTEVDRLLAVVDLIVWVLDPQKYADRVVHKQYLAQFHRHREVTVVALNQVDVLSAEDAEKCLNDLRRLLVEDGLEDVPVLATSAVGPPGAGPLVDVLQRAVVARQASLRRLGADLEGVVEDLEPLVEPPAPSGSLDQVATGRLTNALAHAAGVPVVAAATQRAYVHRARRVTGWPPVRWVRRLRADPLSRLRLGGRPAAPVGGADAPVPATSIAPAAPAAQAEVGLALRALADRAGDSLPPPWRASVLAAARSRMDALPDALDVAVARTDLGLSRTPTWWRLVGGLQWLAALVALIGLLWLAVRYVMFALALPGLPTADVGRIPLPTALLVGGLLAGLLMSFLVRPIVRVAAGRKRRRAVARMRAGVERVGQELVVEPARAVLRDYAKARATLRSARGR